MDCTYDPAITGRPQERAGMLMGADKIRIIKNIPFIVINYSQIMSIG